MSIDVEGAGTLTVQGVSIPRLGFGTWEITGPAGREAVADALDLGYRHIDTARAYGNEREVGQGIAASGVDREDVFVTTKLRHDELHEAGVREQLEGSLAALGLDRVDLLLVHWPSPGRETAIGETLEAMAELAAEGRVANLGVSNFPTVELGEALEATAAPLVADQVEYHPFLDQSKLLRMLRERDMALTAYSPLAQGEVAESDDLREIGEAHGKSAAQVALRWLLEQDNVIAVPRSGSHENRVSNLDVFDFELTAEEHERIDALPKDRRKISPSFAPDWD